MGDQRFQELMSKLGAAFAQVDDGEERRKEARERERRHAAWMEQREAVIAEILSTMRSYGLRVEDLT